MSRLAELLKKSKAPTPAAGSAVNETKTVSAPAPIKPSTPDLPAFVESNNAEVDYIRRQIYELKSSLDNNIPGFATILSDIHKKMKADPHTVTILSPEEIAIAISGMKQHAQIEVVEPNQIKAAKRAAKQPVTANDL